MLCNSGSGRLCYVSTQSKVVKLQYELVNASSQLEGGEEVHPEN